MNERSLSERWRCISFADRLTLDLTNAFPGHAQMRAPLRQVSRVAKARSRSANLATGNRALLEGRSALAYYRARVRNLRPGHRSRNLVRPAAHGSCRRTRTANSYTVAAYLVHR